MLPRLQAQQALQAANIVSIPYLSESDRKNVVRAWQKAAGGDLSYLGPRRLQNAADVRDWFRTAGHRI